MSRGVVAGGLLFTAGHVDRSASDVTGQTRAILAALDALLAEAGATRASVVSANIWLADMASFEEMNAVWDAWIEPTAPPARATVEARLASPDYRVEIALVAAIG
jgi:enamine deaminase RidA (YjgF/YER057c/UK114 family)